mgnify:CR=1 FL=1
MVNEIIRAESQKYILDTIAFSDEIVRAGKEFSRYLTMEDNPQGIEHMLELAKLMVGGPGVGQIEVDSELVRKLGNKGKVPKTFPDRVSIDLFIYSPVIENARAGTSTPNEFCLSYGNAAELDFPRGIVVVKSTSIKPYQN